MSNLVYSIQRLSAKAISLGRTMRPSSSIHTAVGTLTML